MDATHREVWGVRFISNILFLKDREKREKGWEIGSTRHVVLILLATGLSIMFGIAKSFHD